MSLGQRCVGVVEGPEEIETSDPDEMVAEAQAEDAPPEQAADEAAEPDDEHDEEA